MGSRYPVGIYREPPAGTYYRVANSLCWHPTVGAQVEAAYRSLVPTIVTIRNYTDLIA